MRPGSKYKPWSNSWRTCSCPSESVCQSSLAPHGPQSTLHLQVQPQRKIRVTHSPPASVTYGGNWCAIMQSSCGRCSGSGSARLSRSSVADCLSDPHCLLHRTKTSAITSMYDSGTTQRQFPMFFLCILHARCQFREGWTFHHRRGAGGAWSGHECSHFIRC